MDTTKELLPEQRATLLVLLQSRFEKNMNRHPQLSWGSIQSKLDSVPANLWSLGRMEETGGEPDVVDYDETSGEYIFYDCSPESPPGRRSLCYDREALNARKENKPKSSVLDMAAEMGIQLLSEEQYRQLQLLGIFDLKTSCWILTPAEIREAGGALFCDRRYGHVFTYHNGADSYYAARGFRGMIRV